MAEIINVMSLNKKAINTREDKILMITKDAEGQKHHNYIEKPKRTYRVLKPELWDGILRARAKIEDTFEVVTYEKDKIKSIVDTLQDQKISQMYQNAFNDYSTIYNTFRGIERDYRIFNSDGHIADNYMRKYIQKYQEDNKIINRKPISKSYFDIEVDASELEGEFPDQDQAKVPVNIITIVDAISDSVYTLALKYDTDTYREASKDDFKIVKDTLNAKYKNLKNHNLNFYIYEYDSEITLINDFFHLVNNVLKPDYVLAWNMPFDMVTLQNRIIKNGYKPEDIMCPAEFKYRSAYIREDKKANGPDMANHVFDIASYSIYLDQLSTFANIEKPLGQMESFALDYVGEKIVGEKKDEFEGKITDLHLRDYLTFILYNIQDVVLQMLIEDNKKHIDLINTMAITVFTRPNKVTKKTIGIRNFSEVFHTRLGYVISNNHSSLFPKTGIPGAFVASPLLMKASGIEDLNGLMSKYIFEWLMDVDLAKMYPNNCIAFNIDSDSRIMTLAMSNNVTVSDFSDSSKESIELDKSIKEQTALFVDDYISNDPISFCNKYYNLPSPDEMFELVSDQLESLEAN